jgi:hypothetical protein
MAQALQALVAQFRLAEEGEGRPASGPAPRPARALSTAFKAPVQAGNGHHSQGLPRVR